MELLFAYVTNVLLSWGIYFVVGLCAVAVVMAIESVAADSLEALGLKKRIYQVVGFWWLATLLFCAFSPANTPKREHHDKVELNQKIETQNLTREAPQVVDRTLKPEKTTEERKEDFKDLVKY